MRLILRQKMTAPRRSAAISAISLPIVALLLTACQSVSERPAAVPEAEQEGVAELVFQLLHGELSGYDGDFVNAFERYYQASLLTDDPAIAARATEIAVWMKDFERARRAAAAVVRNCAGSRLGRGE